MLAATATGDWAIWRVKSSWGGGDEPAIEWISMVRDGWLSSTPVALTSYTNDKRGGKRESIWYFIALIPVFSLRPPTTVITSHAPHHFFVASFGLMQFNFDGASFLQFLLCSGEVSVNGHQRKSDKYFTGTIWRSQNETFLLCVSKIPPQHQSHFSDTFFFIIFW